MVFLLAFAEFTRVRFEVRSVFPICAAVHVLVVMAVVHGRWAMGVLVFNLNGTCLHKRSINMAFISILRLSHGMCHMPWSPVAVSYPVFVWFLFLWFLFCLFYVLCLYGNATMQYGNATM